MSEYCLLVAYPSCYPVNDICKQAINRIEQYFNSPLADHTVRQPITNPAVMCALHENPVILGKKCYISISYDSKCFFLACHGDEFLSTFAQDYELRNTLTFLSATPENAFYHTKTKTNIIKAPRYNLSAVCNIVQAIKIGNAYKASNSDTSFTKMLVSTPPAPKCLAQQIREACSQETTELHSIFMLLRKLHNTERSFSLSEGANNIFDTYFDKFSQIIEKILPVDSYLA